jgi:hypothetical protein
MMSHKSRKCTPEKMQARWGVKVKSGGRREELGGARYSKGRRGEDKK